MELPTVDIHEIMREYGIKESDLTCLNIKESGDLLEIIRKMRKSGGGVMGLKYNFDKERYFFLLAKTNLGRAKRLPAQKDKEAYSGFDRALESYARVEALSIMSGKPFKQFMESALADGKITQQDCDGYALISGELAKTIEWK